MRSIDFKYMNLKKAYDRLLEVSKLYDGNDDIIRDSLIQRFEFTYELTHKTLREFMKYLGVTLENSFPRTIYKKAYVNNLISNDKVWISLLEDRNSTLHIYSENSMIYKKNIKDFKIDNTENIVSLCVFGSYNTEFWDENRSDIDILILLNKNLGVEFEFKIEDELLLGLQKFFEFDNIHIVFLYMNEFDNTIADSYLLSNNKIIIDFEREIDFRMYVNKYHRDNEWLENIIKEDMKLMKGNKNVTIL